MRVNLDAKPGSLPSALQQPGKAGRGGGRAALAGEHERRLGILFALQPAQRPQLVADDGMRRRRAPLGPADVQGRSVEVDLIPAKVGEFGHAQAVAVGDEDQVASR